MLTIRPTFSPSSQGVGGHGKPLYAVAMTLKTNKRACASNTSSFGHAPPQLRRRHHSQVEVDATQTWQQLQVLHDELDERTLPRAALAAEHEDLVRLISHLRVLTLLAPASGDGHMRKTYNYKKY